MRGKVTIVGCPKLDPVDYSENVANVEKFQVSNVANWNWTLGMATLDIGNIPKFIPWQVVTLSLDGRMIDS